MKRARIEKIVLLTFASMLLVMSIFGAQLAVSVDGSTTLDVYPGQSIQEAINIAESGETIFVHAGNYSENVVVNKTVSLIGEDQFKTIVDGGGTRTVINVTAEYVKITGFTIQNGGSGYGIYAHHSYGNNISYNVVKDNSIGIWLNKSNTNILMRNNCTLNDFDGIFLKSSNDNIVSANTACGNDYGIWVEESSNNFITGNNASDNNIAGFWITKSKDNEFSGNTASNEQFGFWVVKSANNVFSGNLVRCGRDFYGITLLDSNNNTIESNTALNNFLGIRLDANSTLNMIFHNNLLNNNITLRGFWLNSLDNGVEGNYWSDYNGTDQDKDGIGDTPYVKNENNTDYYPLMGMLSDFKAGLEGETYHVFAISNSTINELQYNDSAKKIDFNIGGQDDASGFCRIVFPQVLINEPYVVLIDGDEVNARLLPVSNSTHAFLYFTYVLDPRIRGVTIVSRPYHELSEKYDALLTEYNNLSSMYENLNEIYHGLLGNYSELYWSFDSLNESHNFLLGLYESLNSTYTDLKSQSTRELNEIRTLVNTFAAAFIVAIVLGTAVLLPFGVKYYRISNEQKKIIQAYNPLEIANVLFKTDVERRRMKIGKFEEKYGVKIRPHDTLEDVIMKIRMEKKVKR